MNITIDLTPAEIGWLIEQARLRSGSPTGMADKITRAIERAESFVDDSVTDDEYTEGWRVCASCDGNGDDWVGHPCNLCHGTGREYV